MDRPAGKCRRRQGGIYADPEHIFLYGLESYIKPIKKRLALVSLFAFAVLLPSYVQKLTFIKDKK